MRVDLGKVDENRKSREESINAPVSALLCKLAREPCVNTLTQAAAHFCPQIGSTWLNMVFHFKEVLHKTTLAMDTIYFAFSGANCATLALAHLHWPTYWKMSFPGQVWGWHSASWATRATTMFTRRRARFAIYLDFLLLERTPKCWFFLVR